MMDKKKFTILLLGLAVLVGALHVGPQLVIKKTLDNAGEVYLPIQLNTKSDITNVYLPRAREIYDGNFPPADPNFSEKISSAFPPTAIYVVPLILEAPFIFAFNGNINSAYLAINFVVPAILFLLFYLLSWFITRSRVWSMFLGLLGILTPTILHLPRAFKGPGLFADLVVKNFYPLIRTPLDTLFFSRISDPLFTYLIYLPAIITLYLFWQKPSKKRGVFAGLFAGFLFYTYFYYSFYWAGVVGLLFLYTMVFGRKDKNLVRGFVILLALMVIIVTPYFVNYFSLQGVSSYQDHIFRAGIEVGKGFRFSSVWFEYLSYIIIGALVGLAYRRKDRAKLILFGSFLVSAFIVWNLQLITGFVPHPGHWRKAISPALFVILASLLFDCVSRYGGRENYKKILVGFLVLGSLLLVTKKAVNILEFRGMNASELSVYSFDKDIYKSWGWINENMEGEPKIVSSSFISSVYLFGYTPAKLFLPMSEFTLRGNFDLEERYLLANKVFDVSASDLRKRLTFNFGTSANKADDPFYLYSSFYRDKQFDFLLSDSAKTIPQEKVDELIERYNALDFVLADIDADYVYYGPWEQELSQIRPFDNNALQPIYRNDTVGIFKIKR